MHRRVVLAAVAAALAVAGTTVAVGLAGSARAAAGCTASYRVNQWPGGFVAYVDVTAGANPVHSWQVTWTYQAGQTITSSWSAQVTQNGQQVTAVNAAYNGELPAGGTTEFGLQGTYSGSNPTPTDLVVTGDGCGSAPPPTSPTPSPTRQNPTPTPTRTSPSPTPTPTRTSPSPTPTPTRSVPPPSGCSGATLCDGFENQTGSTPSGAWTTAYRDCQGSGTASIDSSVAHSGSKSLRIDGAAGYCNHVFVSATGDLSGIGPVWYARFYVRHTTALPAGHVTFAAMRDANDGGNDLRMGGQNGALQWNRQSDDATLPEQSPNGVALSMPLPTNQWTCVEFMVNGSNGTMDTWVNGSQVAGLHEDGTPTHDIDSQWLSRSNWRPSLTNFRLGWESYGTGSDTLWFDDVALGSSRIGC